MIGQGPPGVMMIGQGPPGVMMIGQGPLTASLRVLWQR
jgi:hypothetical protein